MEPLLLACEGCGVRIRTADPDRARGRDCPRCETPLAPAVDKALGLRAPAVALKSAPDFRRAVAPAVAFVILGGVALLAARGPAKPPASSSTRVRPVAAPVAPQALRTSANPNPSGPIEEADPVGPASPTPPPGDRTETELTPPPPSRPEASTDRPPPIPAPSPATSPSNGPRRLMVRDARGRAIVAREYGALQGRTAAILPDGQVGWPEGLVETDAPFVPMTPDAMRQDLLEDPDFAAFRVHQTTHYLVVYQSSEPFARASAELLEKLHDGLTLALKKNGLPVEPMEFPLVAVIFATEDDFRADRRVARDIQAYYEIRSNRIYLYEKSSRDQDSPEVSALRRPQTVAHEGTHQILHNVGVQPRLSDWPLWLVEGLAEYCSPARFTKKGVDWAGLGQANPIHLATIRDLDDPLPAAFRGDRREALVARDRGTPLVEYLVTRKDLTPTDYAFSWALTHYLATQRLDDFVAYIQRMSRLKPFEEQSPEAQLAAFREVFGTDLAQMDAKVGKHLKKFKSTDALPHYAVIFEQPVGPGSVRRQYMVSQSPSVIRQWIDSITAPEGGPPHWRVVPHATQKKAIEAADLWMSGGR